MRKLPQSGWLSNLCANVKLRQFPEIILEQELVSAHSYLFGSSEDSKTRAYDFNQTFLLNNSFDRTNIDQNVSLFVQIPDIGKDLSEIRKDGKRYFLSQQKPYLRHIDLMDYVSSQRFIRQIRMTNESIFVFVDHSNTLNIFNDEQYCIEFDRKTLIVTEVH